MALTATSEVIASHRRALGRDYVRSRLKALLNVLVALWVFTGGLVLVDPSPYEISFLVVLPVALVGGIKLYRSTLGLLILLLGFAPFALIAAFRATYTPLPQALLFQFVTIFLLLTAYFTANYVAEAPQRRVKLIVTAYTLVAVASSIVGTAGYLGLIPGAGELLLRYGRVKAFFQDPNVFGPFLVVPAMYALQRVLLGRGRQAMLAGVVVLALLIGVFVSFSRAAWGNMFGAAVITFVLCFTLEANARDKLRMIFIALAGLAMAVLAIGGLLSIPSVARLFGERASVEQNYDSGSTGRFGRQSYAFDLALSNPWGIGPAEFRNLRVVEEPHDTYVSTIHVYGWGGAFCYDAIIVLTLWRAFGALFQRSPNRRLLIPLIAVFVPLIIEAAIIDADHWRHYYLVVGLIWGITAGYQRLQPKEDRQTALV